MECGSKLIVTTYNGSDELKELVCPKCGLIHAVFGHIFYLDTQNKIIDEYVSRRIHSPPLSDSEVADIEASFTEFSTKKRKIYKNNVNTLLKDLHAKWEKSGQ